MRRLVLLVAVFCLTIVSVSPVVFAAEPKPETRLYVSDQCLVTGNTGQQSQGLFAAIGAVLLPKAIEWVIDLAVEELTKIRKEESAGSVRLYLYKKSTENRFPDWNPLFHCVTMVTAVFSKGDDVRKSAVIKGDNFDFSTTVNTSAVPKAAIEQRLQDNDVTTEKIYSVYEAELEWALDGSAYKYKSVLLWNNELLAGKKEAAQVIVIRVDGPGTKPDGTAYSIATISFGKVTPGDPIPHEKLKKGSETGWISRPGMSASSLIAFYANRTKTTSYSPVKLGVSNIQTRKPSDAAKMVAAVLKASKEKLASTISDSILTDEEAAREKAQLDAEIAVYAAKVEKETADAGSSQIAKDLADAKLKKACDALKELDRDTALCS